MSGTERVSITFHRARPADSAATPMIAELSATLAGITGDSGKCSFSAADMADLRSVFLLVKFGESAVAGGALRRIDDHTCELKRIYSRAKRSGQGTLLSAKLEKGASRLGYSQIRLETWKVNQRAVGCYHEHGYAMTPNYGKQVGNDGAVFFEKKTETPQPPAPMRTNGQHLSP